MFNMHSEHLLMAAPGAHNIRIALARLIIVSKPNKITATHTSIIIHNPQSLACARRQLAFGARPCQPLPGPSTAQIDAQPLSAKTPDRILAII